jgi:AAHS family 4-hydroxybenzoate transporter-like MFS transporter
MESTAVIGLADQKTAQGSSPGAVAAHSEILGSGMGRVRASMDVETLIDERPMTRVQVLVAVLCAMAVFFDGYDIQVMALAVPALAQEWGLAPSRFGMALAAVVVGLTLGAALLSPLGDRFGRRAIVIVSLLLVGLTTACTALATSPEQFTVWRFLTGIGLGMCLPNCNAWTSEYAPLRKRALVVVLMNSAIGIGAFSAGFLAPPLIELWSWRAAFVLGGAAPILIALVLFACAPESLKFLVARRPGDPRIAAILRSIAPQLDAALIQAVAIPAAAPRGSVLTLLAPAYRARTLVLWGVLFLNLFTLYLLISWLPTLLQSAGWSLSDALRGAVTIQAGGVLGGILLALFLDSGKAVPALRAAFGLAATCLALFLVVPSGAAWTFMLLLVGGGVAGTQLSLNALSTAYYPPVIKATGTGWAAVIGNLGAMGAPLAGAWLIDLGVPSVSILAMLGVPVLLCASGVMLMRRDWQAY